MNPDPAQQKNIQRSLDISWKEGLPASVMLGIIDYYIAPFGIFLGASIQEIGLLIALPQLLASIAQLFAVGCVRLTGSRLKFLVATSALQAVLLIPIAFLAVIPTQAQIFVLILFVTLFRVVGNLIATAWGSLVSDYLPAQRRGHYFGWRSQIVGFACLASVVLSGIILFVTKKIHPDIGFLIIFLIAFVARMFSVWLMAKMTDLPLSHAPEHDFSFLDFIKRFRESNFVKFVLYSASVIFATFIAAPYISVYVLRDLKFDYLSYMGLQLASVLTGLIAFPIFGKHADLVGNAKILKNLSFVIPIIPLLWLATPLFDFHPAYCMSVEMLAGFIWGGFNLCATNFVYDAVSPEKRVRCLGYFNLITGCAIFGGSVLGGFLVEHVPPIAGFSILTLFLISSLARFAAHFFLSPHFKEVRDSTRKVTSRQLFFSVLGVRPLDGLSREWGFFKE